MALCFGLICCAWLVSAGFIWLKIAYHGVQARSFHWRLQALNMLTLSSFMGGIFILSQTGPGFKIAGLALFGANIAFGYFEQKLWRRAIEY